MRNPLGYKVLKTYQQGEQLYQLTREFTAAYLEPAADRRLIAHMDDAARSVPRNIAEGYGRNNTKQYQEFLGFAYGSLVELLEDYLDLEKDIKGGQRKTRDNEAALGIISTAIKLLMGERTMLKHQMEKVNQMVNEQGLKPQRQLDAEWKAGQQQRWQAQDRWLAEELRKARDEKENKGQPGTGNGQQGETKHDKGLLGAAKEALLSLVLLSLPLFSLVPLSNP